MVDSSSLHVIFGAGAAGCATAEQLVADGRKVRVINRDGQRPPLMPDGVEMIAADASQLDQVSAAAVGAGVIYNCLNVPYQYWEERLPRFQTNVLTAAREQNARLIALENLYSYGPVEGPMTEDLPLEPTAKKGKIRAAMTRELMEAYEAGEAEVVIGRASDFYGPGVTGSFLGERAFGPLVKGKPAQVIGDPDQPHSYAYIKDIGKGLAVLGANTDSSGQIWHLPHAPAVSTRDMLDHAFELVAQEPKVNAMGRVMLMLGGLFIPEARESIELLYEFDRPFLVDDSKFRDTFNLLPTAIPTGLQRTVRWYQQHYTN